jgi:hypothetical protein
MSQSIEEKCQDGGGSKPDPEQLTDQQENPQHEASNKQAKDQLQTKFSMQLEWKMQRRTRKSQTDFKNKKKRSQRILH